MFSAALKDPRGGHNRSKVNQKFFQKWSPPMAYVLGFIFADGAIEDVQKSSRTCYLAMSSKDLSLLEQIKKVMRSNHKFYTRQPHLVTYTDGEKYTSSEQFIFRIGSKTIYNDLLVLGVTPRKSLTVLFPNIPLQFLAFFLRGYFDGDGCLYLVKGKYPRVVFTSGSNLFLTGLANILSTVLNIPIKLPYSQLQNSKNLCYRLHYNTQMGKKILEFMYQNLNASPYLERKFLIYQKYLQKIKN